MKLKCLAIGLLLFVGHALSAQSVAVQRMKPHIEILSSDSLEGREAGTRGEILASDYIARYFESVGLKAAGTEGFFQPFEFFNGRNVTSKTVLELNGKPLVVNQDYQVLPQSHSFDFSCDLVWVGYGIHAPELGRDDYKGKKVKNTIVVVERGHHEPENPHSQFVEASTVDAKIKAAEKHGAIGIVFVDPAEHSMDPLILDYHRKVATSGMVAVYMKGMTAKQLNKKRLWGEINLQDDMKNGRNVVALLDHGAAHTIVIGAHYDHLGFGHDGSLYRGEPAIHNGADDNASGTAMLMELAQELKKDAYKGYNYQFIAFSGEEKGLLGSNYYTKNPTIDLAGVSCMINFDMVGRLDPAKNTLGINGTGTSPTWNVTLDGIQIDDMKVMRSESGVGPSDQTSFYLKQIPAIHYFSGTHGDYHKPSDDAHTISYEGMDKIFRHVSALIAELNKIPRKLEFTSTKDETSDVPKWKVTLGVVPDYMFTGEGMRIDGVTDGKPASKAGLKTGDVVTKMGDVEVKDMQSYMRALAKFEKGQSTDVEYLREGKKQKTKVTF